MKSVKALLPMIRAIPVKSIMGFGKEDTFLFDILLEITLENFSLLKCFCFVLIFGLQKSPNLKLGN